MFRQELEGKLMDRHKENKRIVLGGEFQTIIDMLCMKQGTLEQRLKEIEEAVVEMKLKVQIIMYTPDT